MKKLLVLFVLLLLTTTALCASEQTTCNCDGCTCNGESCPLTVYNFLQTDLTRYQYCPNDKVPAIGHVNIEAIDDEDETYSYYLVDENGRKYTFKRGTNNKNCTNDSSMFRMRQNRPVKMVAYSSGFGGVHLKYNIEMYCAPRPADNCLFAIDPPNPKYYLGSTVGFTVNFINMFYQTVDTWLYGTIYVKNTNKRLGRVIAGVGKIEVPILEDSNFQLEFKPDTVFVDEPAISDISLPKIAFVQQSTKGQFILDKQPIYSGKEFIVHFQMVDSDNLPSHSIQVELLKVSSSDNPNMFCKFINFISGTGIVSCISESSGTFNLLLDYNKVRLQETSIDIVENPTQYALEFIFLLLLVTIGCVCGLAIMMIGFIVYTCRKSKGNNVKGVQSRHVVREEDAEELDNI